MLVLLASVLFVYSFSGLPRRAPKLSLGKCSEIPTLHAAGVCRRSVLDPGTWSSAAWVTFPRGNMTIDEKRSERPLFCEFSNVYVTASHVYFVAYDSDYQTAADDIARCCGLGTNLYNTKVCEGSVHHDLCFCFHNAKYVAGTWANDNDEIIHLSLTGSTWLMHHFSVAHHPDHFSMKILELHGLIAAQQSRTHLHAELLPPRFDSLLSMDYPGPVSAFTDYESFVYKLLRLQTKPTHGYHFLNLEGRSLYNRLYQADQTLKLELYAAQPSSVPLRVAHVERAYTSPRYKNNLPEPVDLSISALQESFRRILGGRDSTRCLQKHRPRTNITIAVLYRDEGSGLRQFVNINEMMLSIRRVVKESEIKVWFISSTTPALDQALLFCSFHILISPHSSQLSNLVFTPAGLSVIEIQNEQLVENTFEQLGRRSGLHYQLLKTGNHPPKNGSYAKTADVVVNIALFEAAVAEAVSAVRLQGYVV
jgi:Glycosyltransferase 61